MSNLVSVVIPAYNAGQWIGETLNSVLAQDYLDLEVIVVDDGSTDNTSEVIRDQFPCVTLPCVTLIRVANGGPSFARNIGWRCAKGEWIQFLDADDIIHPKKISLQVPHAMSALPKVAVVYSMWQRIATQEDGSWKPMGEIRKPHILSPIPDLLRSENFIPFASGLTRRDFLLQAGGFDESMRVLEDIHLQLHIAALGGDFAFIPSEEPLFFYRYVPSSLSNQNRLAFSQAALHNVLFAEEILNKSGSIHPATQEVFLSVYHFIARSSFGVDPPTFEAAFQALKRLSPNNQYLPKEPLSLRIASRIFGYRFAEFIAFYYRKVKSFLDIPR